MKVAYQLLLDFKELTTKIELLPLGGGSDASSIMIAKFLKQKDAYLYRC